MNKKILLGIILPATHKIYDFWVPVEMPMFEVSTFISEILGIRVQDRFTATAKNSLMVHETGKLLEPHCTAKKAELVNGSLLLFV
jgi:hypothetical protein